MLRDQEIEERRIILTVLAGVSALMIVMGVGRFAYTPILPVMQASEHYSDAVSGYLASSNYLGYLFGAFAAGFRGWKRGRVFHLRLHLLLNIMTTGGMGLANSIPFWLILRFISGVTSGFVFVLVSNIVLDTLATRGRSTWSGIFYGGTGLGIITTGILVPFLVRVDEWRGAWFGLAMLCLVVGVLPWQWIREQPTLDTYSNVFTQSTSSKQSKIFPWLLSAYGCEGLGYIVSGTFLVSLVARIPSMHGYAEYSWILVGAAAIPSCVIWARIAIKWGFIRTLVMAYFWQVMGVVLPVLFPDPIGVFTGSLLFGGTFMGITTVATTLVRTLYPDRSRQAIGYMTGVYGIGQIIGPTGAGVLAEISHGYNVALLFAGSILLVGLILLLIVDSRAEKGKAMAEASEPS